MKKIILPLVFLVLFLGIFCSRFIIKVKNDCRSQYGACPDSINKELSAFDGKSMFSAQNLIKKKLKSSFLISDFSIQFKLPNILRVDLIIKKPVYAIKSEVQNNFALIDKEGYVLAISGDTQLPYISVKQDLPKPGDKIDSKLLLALELIDGVNNLYQIRSSTIEGDTLLVDLPGPIRVIFPLVGSNREMLLGSLRLIYSNIQSGENKALYTQIDLRYTNPVLR